MPAQGTSGQAGTAWNGDESFLPRAVEAHARLGAAASSDACRRDHETARRELETLVQRRQWTVPSAGGQGPQRDPGSTHEQALAAFTQAASQASDPELRAWAERSAGMIRAHIAAGKGQS